MRALGAEKIPRRANFTPSLHLEPQPARRDGRPPAYRGPESSAANTNSINRRQKRLPRRRYAPSTETGLAGRFFRHLIGWLHELLVVFRHRVLGLLHELA